MAKLKTLVPPITIEGAALEFWNRHAVRLTKAGRLTESDLDSFVMLCDLWALHVRLRQVLPGAENFREMVQRNNVSKEYHKFARSFGLLPVERIKGKMNAEAEDEPDEFGL